MKAAKRLALLAVQLILAAGLTILHLNGEASVWLWRILLAALAGTTVLLILSECRFRKGLAHLTDELRRAADGNWRMRLLSKEDPVWNEMIFTVNGLIDRLESVQIEAVRSQTARKRLLSGISHDIRTPLTSIIGYVDAMKDDLAATGEEKREYLDILSRKSNGLKELIGDMFTMAKLDADEMPLKEEALDWAEMAREALIVFLPGLEREQIRLEVRFPEDPCIIHADRLSLMRIMGNILKNAVRYGNEGKVLGVELAETARAYELVIRDRGPGITQAELAHVFERSFRGDQARGSHSGGSGLGLAIAKALAEKNGGTVRVESIPWDKTEFTLSFPKPPMRTS